MMTGIHEMREHTRILLQQETVAVSTMSTRGRFDDLMGELIDRFPQVSFSLVHRTEKEAAIYVLDTDFFFSPSFGAFLDELAARLPPEQTMDLDFYPVEVTSPYRRGPESSYEIKGTAMPMHKMDPAQPRTGVSKGTTTWDYVPFDGVSKAA